MSDRSNPHPKTYWIETYGCQMNVAESHELETMLQGVGLQPASSAENADCAILNTCSVRKTAENRIWGRLGLFQHIKQERLQTLIVTGCMAERLKEELIKEAPAIDHVVGTNDKHRIVELLTGVASGTCLLDGARYEFGETYHKDGDYSSFVPIMNGCNLFCSYCIVPFVRGREISRNPQAVINEVRRLDSLGVKEITLLGQTVNNYRYKKEDGTFMRFPELLELICVELDSIRWVRFESPHPRFFTRELIDVIARNPRIARHLHIPMQSGSSSILKAMMRDYSREKFLTLIADIREKIPDVTFATDVMVGFPGETEEDYELTLSAMDECRNVEAFMYYWNPREGTKAVDLPDHVPETVKLARLQILIDRQLALQSVEKTARLGKDEDILVTGHSRDDKDALLGRTEHNGMVVFIPYAPLHPGDVARVRLDSLSGGTFRGTHVL
ncbi:tRNA (N6-isopentenyl adenosine(37)-C2)-methylthiotransferase MiaB [Parasphaerochaeta coccoides]|uniref:tRNA-2-methylthio-N(6)-dimethylallyladenosine synthase n=1 Tax=Parasphaerochaeta coccoides (strain ATCC BAA-1237 / DSM 17374 / SPN1) TaxID=760011 RepID=F4GJ72_PARC1|nr:tRNA (N6-isopentenyl adenosine(37)-C2)-methylthiotransferase MiaB [Parasphaerochaeta coccoides]AEC01712.1 tRNA-i(6)A37 thiotransferase enzyme MiaB [Parasphaerochaeta coccoides DSM 17374]